MSREPGPVHAAFAIDSPIAIPDVFITGTVAGYSTDPTRPVLATEGVYQSGVLAGTNRRPGKDYSYKTLYKGESGAVRVYLDEVENPRWLVHRVEWYFRQQAQQWWERTPQDKSRVPPYRFEVRSVDGQWVFVDPYLYVWTSGENRVVQLTRGSFQLRADGGYEHRDVPEDFLLLYLERLPSSVPSITFDVAHEQQYIREEFDRDFEDAAYFLAQWRAAPKTEKTGPGYVNVRGILGDVRDRQARYFGGLSDREWDRKLTEKEESGQVPQGVSMQYSFWQAQYDELKEWWSRHHDDPIQVVVPAWLPGH